MSLFASLAGAAKRAQNAVHGEAVRVVPTMANASPNARGRLLDPARPAFDAVVRFYRPTERIGDEQVRRDVLRSGAGDRAMHARSTIIAVIDDPQSALRDDDMIERQSDGAIHQIVDVERDGTGSFILHLVAAPAVPEA